MDKTINRKAKESAIDWNTRHNILKFKAEYNTKRDILLIYSEEDRPAVSVDCKGEYWVRVDPQNGEILGIEIEDFKKVFLKKHPGIIKEKASEKTSYIRPIAEFIGLTNCPV
jgi:uncharacterized protein YuzE